MKLIVWNKEIIGGKTKEYKITYSNNTFNIICIEYVEAKTKKIALNKWLKENKENKNIEFMEIESEEIKWIDLIKLSNKF